MGHKPANADPRLAELGLFLAAAMAYTARMQSTESIAAGDLLTLAEAGRATGLSHSHLRLLANQGRIWCIKKGKVWLTTLAAVEAYRATLPKPGPKPRTDSAEVNGVSGEKKERRLGAKNG